MITVIPGGFTVLVLQHEIYEYALAILFQLKVVEISATGTLEGQLQDLDWYNALNSRLQRLLEVSIMIF